MASTLGKVLSALRRLLTGAQPEPPGDPYARVRVPLGSGPPNRSSSVALEEPDETH